MKQRLEDFINENRAEFDSEQPAPKIWKNIEKDLEQPEKKTVVSTIAFRRWAVAASVIAAVSIGAYFISTRSSDQSTQSELAKGSQEQVQPGILDEINPTYAKEVYHFTQLIELKQNELKQIGKDQPELYKQFMSDIVTLDSAYNRLQKELPANPNREQLLEAMIQNLQLQTDLLNQQLRVIKQIRQSKTSSNESNSKSI